VLFVRGIVLLLSHFADERKWKRIKTKHKISSRILGKMPIFYPSSCFGKKIARSENNLVKYPQLNI